MYEHFFGLREKPFSLLPDPAFLYFGGQHSSAYALLEYGVLNQAGFTVVTGEVGCGKTTLIRHLLNQVDAEVNVGLLANVHHGTNDLLRWVLMAFGLEYESKGSVGLYEALIEFLVAEYAQRRRAALIVDEAQNLNPATLEELRTLSNVNADKDLLLQLILVGQPELKTTLERPELRQLAQRVVAHYHLTALSEDECVAYIRHRLERAGGSADLFTPEACLQVFRHTGGVPRLINLLCDTALVYGFAEGARQVGVELVKSVIEEKAAGMGLWRAVEPEEVATPATTEAVEKKLPDGSRSPAGSASKPDRSAKLNRADARQLFSHLVKGSSTKR
jgi:type II secretory pathway predicted ATPase ExeA